MGLNSELEELIQHNVIDQITANRIQEYYSIRKKSKPNIILLIFGVLGSILIGLGIILIIGHNWDTYPRWVKTTFAFIPIITGQLACVYSILKKRDSPVWMESSGIFLSLAIGACIALIAQIYNISGDPAAFYKTWMLLCLPLIYILNSQVVSLFVIGGISYYALIKAYYQPQEEVPYLYWLMLILIIPYYLNKLNENKNSFLFSLQHRFLALSIFICFSTIIIDKTEILIFVYLNLCGLYIIFGKLFFDDLKFKWSRIYSILGFLGFISLLFVLSFEDYWDASNKLDWTISKVASSPEGILGLILIGLSLALLIYFRDKIKDQAYYQYFVPFIPFLIFCLRINVTTSVWLINIIILIIGVWSIRQGVLNKALGQMNIGLSIIALLIIFRFFDIDISFVWRGIGFLVIGACFFVSNYLMVKSKKKNEDPAV